MTLRLLLLFVCVYAVMSFMPLNSLRKSTQTFKIWSQKKNYGPSSRVNIQPTSKPSSVSVTKKPSEQIKFSEAKVVQQKIGSMNKDDDSYSSSVEMKEEDRPTVSSIKKETTPIVAEIDEEIKQVKKESVPRIAEVKEEIIKEDVVVVVKEDKNANVNTNEPEPETEPVPLEEQLRQEVALEATAIEERARQSTLLQTQIQRSVSRRKEVEEIIIRELSVLRERIQNEKDEESDRYNRLQSLSINFNKVISDKEVIIKRETGLLQEMNDLGTRINEKIILNQLNEAIDKKQNLISIESDIFLDLQVGLKQVTQEIDLTQSKLDRLQDLLKTLPSPDDRDAVRQYGWLDVEALEKELLSNSEERKERGVKVQVLLEKFEEVIMRRGAVLGEIPKFVNEFKTQKNNQVNNIDSSSSSSESSQSKTPRVSKNIPSVQETRLVLRDQSNDELQRVALEAVVNTGRSIVKILVGLIDTSSTFLKSEEATDSKKAIELAANAATEAAGSLGQTFETIKDTWDVSVGDAADFESLIKGVQSVFQSKDVKGSLSSVGAQLKKSGQEISTAAQISTSKVGKEIQSNNGLGDALDDAKEGVSLLAAASAVVGTRAIETLQAKVSKE